MMIRKTPKYVCYYCLRTPKEVGQLWKYRFGKCSRSGKKVYMCRICKFLFGKYILRIELLRDVCLPKINERLKKLDIQLLTLKDYASLDIDDISYPNHFYFKDIKKRFYRL